MSAQAPSPLQQPLQNATQAAPGVDFEGIESLLQQPRVKRAADGDDMPIATENFATEGQDTSERLGSRDESTEQGQGDTQPSSQERQSDAQYAPISNPPAFGQVCR